MAKGQVYTIPSGSGRLVTTSSREEKQSFALLNPNDGVVYLRLNAPSGPSIAEWDWKLPSQSYGQFPGPWESLGLYFLDQSGAGRQGELNLYDTDTRLDIPDIHSIGRALQAQSTSMDITQGPIPANPPLGITRLWADVNGLLHNLDSGIDTTLLDSGMVDSVTAAMIVAGAIGTAELGDSQITAGKILNSNITTEKIAANAVTQVGASYSDGATYQTSNLNTIMAVPGWPALTMDAGPDGCYFLMFTKLTFWHSVVGAFINFGVGIDAFATSPQATMQVPVAYQFNQLIGHMYGFCPAGVHSFYPCWWMNTAGTMNRQAWYNDMFVLMLKR